MDAKVLLQCKNKVCLAHPALTLVMENWYSAITASQEANQAYAAHDNAYPKVEEASEVAWQLWPKIGRAAPEGWQPKVMTDYLNKAKLLCQAIKEADHAMKDAFQTLTQQLAELDKASSKLTLGPGQFGHSGEPSPKPATPSVVDLSEAYILANRAIHTHRAKFFKLNLQEKKIKLITVAKTLAKLQSDKNRAHHKLVKASRPKFSPETKSLLKWKNPAGGIHALIVQGFKVSQLCQPLQLPFQLLWPPDPVAIQSQSQPLNAKLQSQPQKFVQSSNSNQPQRQSQNKPLIEKRQHLMLKRPPHLQPPSFQGQPQKVVQITRSRQPLDRRKYQHPVASQSRYAQQPRQPERKRLLSGQHPKFGAQSHPPAAESKSPDVAQLPIVQLPDLPPDPDPDPRSSVSKEDWGKWSIDPG